MFKEFAAAKDLLRIRKNQRISYLRANFSGAFCVQDYQKTFEPQKKIGFAVSTSTLNAKQYFGISRPVFCYIWLGCTKFSLKVGMHSIYLFNIQLVCKLSELKLVQHSPRYFPNKRYLPTQFWGHPPKYHKAWCCGCWGRGIFRSRILRHLMSGMSVHDANKIRGMGLTGKNIMVVQIKLIKMKSKFMSPFNMG